MCRSGRMFAPTKVWRKWHQKINLGQKYVSQYLLCYISIILSDNHLRLGISQTNNKFPGASLQPLLLPRPQSRLSSWPVATRSQLSLKYPLSLPPPPSKVQRLVRPQQRSLSSKPSEQAQTSSKFARPANCELERANCEVVVTASAADL